MKTRGFTFVLLFTLICVFSVLSLGAFAQNAPIVVAGDEEKEGGYLVDITREALERVGYAPEFRFIPWVRALNQSIEGKYTMLLSAYYTEERAEKLIYSEPIGSARVFFLKRKDQEISYTSIDDLRSYRIGHIRGSKVNQEFDSAESDFLKMEYVVSTEQNIKKLLSGRLDLVVEKEQQILQLLGTEFQDEADSLELLYPPLQVNNFYNCVSKALPNAQQIIDDFNRGLQMIEEDGTLSAILTKHGISTE